MKNVLAEDKELHDWLKEIPPRHWSKSHFSGRVKCDVLLNNLCEVLNMKLVNAREEPIIICLDYIREYLMKRNVVVHNMIAKSQGPRTPAATKLFDKIKTEATDFTVIFNGVNKCQVNDLRGDQKNVNLEQENCSCRK